MCVNSTFTLPLKRVFFKGVKKAVDGA